MNNINTINLSIKFSQTNFDIVWFSNVKKLYLKWFIQESINYKTYDSYVLEHGKRNLILHNHLGKRQLILMFFFK